MDFLPFSPQPNGRFPCTGDALIVRNVDAQLGQLEEATAPLTLLDVGAPAGIEYNSLGFRSTDGLLYAVELHPGGNVQVLQIDASGTVTGLGRPDGLPTDVRFDGGAVSTDGSTLFVTANGQDLYSIDLSSVPDLPPVTAVAISGATGFVFDWAFHPSDGKLYGGDSTHGEVAILDPATGVRTDVALPDLPAGTAYGGAWFDASGRLSLYRNDGEIYEIDLSVPAVVDVRTGPSATRNDAASCVQSLIGAAQRMTSQGGGLPETVTLEYVFESFSTVADVFNLSARNGLSLFGAEGIDWRFVSISSSPAGFSNPAFDGVSDTELIQRSPPRSLAPGESASIQVVVDLLSLDNVDADGRFCDRVLVTATAGGLPIGDRSTAGIDPDPDGDGVPAERATSCLIPGQVPFTCSGQTYVIQDVDAQLTAIDPSTSTFAFDPVGLPLGIEVNSLGLRSTDGLAYGVELSGKGNVQIVQIDATGSVFGLGRPADGSLPEGPRFDAGDVSSDGRAMFLTATHEDLYRVDLTAVPFLPPVTSVEVTGATGLVFDWAFNPADGLLYGGDSTDGQLAVLDPASGVRTDTALPGLPPGTAFGGAWFGVGGNLFLYRNSGTIFEIDLSGPAIVGSQDGPASTRNDAAVCRPLGAKLDLADRSP